MTIISYAIIIIFICWIWAVFLRWKWEDRVTRKSMASCNLSDKRKRNVKKNDKKIEIKQQNEDECKLQKKRTETGAG